MYIRGFHLPCLHNKIFKSHDISSFLQYKSFSLLDTELYSAGGKVNLIGNITDTLIDISRYLSENLLRAFGRG